MGAFQLEHAHQFRQLARLVLRACCRGGFSTSAAFCWVTSSICVMAWLTCSMPSLCSELAAVISPRCR
jgi:hypothetical protein